MQFGINPVYFLKSDSMFELFSWLVLVAVLISYAVVIIMFALGYDLGLSFRFLDYAYTEISGIIIIVLGFLVMVFAHANMGRHWRMGIDREKNIKLVTAGLFSISRNPVYVGIMIQAFGLFLVMKTLLSVVLLVILCLAFLMVVYTEEAFLEKRFGKEYLNYKKNVRRFL